MFCFLENALQRSFLIFLIHFHGYKSKHLTAVFKHGNHVNLHSEQTFVTLPNTSILIDGALPPHTTRCIEGVIFLPNFKLCHIFKLKEKYRTQHFNILDFFLKNVKHFALFLDKEFESFLLRKSNCQLFLCATAIYTKNL